MIESNIGWQVLLVLNLLLSGAATVVTLIRGGRQRIDPQPLQVQAAAEYVSKEVFDAAVTEVKEEQSRLFSKLGGMERGLRDEVRRDVAELHEKVNGVSVQVGALSKATDLQNQQLAQISAKLDRVAERRSS